MSSYSKEGQNWIRSKLPSSKLCVGYSLVLTCNVAHSISAISAQLSMAETAIFELSFLWNMFSLAISFCLLNFLGQSFRIKREHISLLIITSLFDYVCTSTYYLASVFIPVGNTEGVYVCMLIICTTSVDIVRGVVAKKALLPASVAIVGIVLLVQPWNIVKEHHDQYETPCQLMHSLFMVNSTCQFPNTSTIQCIYNNTSDEEQILSKNRTYLHNPQHANFQNGSLYHNIANSKHSQIYGYALVAVSAISETLNGNFAQSLMETYPVAALIYWASVIQGSLSFMLTFSCYKFPGYGGWSIPLSHYCLLLTLLYISMVSVMDVTDYYAYDFLPVSQVAIMQAWITILLYACQRFFMFNSGNENILEIIGALMAFTGAILQPILTQIELKSGYTPLQDIQKE